MNRYLHCFIPLLLGLCIVLLILRTRKSRLFDPKDHERLHCDGAVLRHELGHAVTWFCFGGIIDRITFTRLKQTCGTSARKPLMGDTEVSFGHGTPDESAENAELVALRILAGESAARRWARMTRGRICTGGLELHRNCNLDAILRAHCNSLDDFINILGLTAKWGKTEWYNWIHDRLKAARILVDANWEVIEHLASKHERWLPHQRRRLLCHRRGRVNG